MSALGEAKEWINRATHDLGSKFDDFAQKSHGIFGTIVSGASEAVDGFVGLATNVGTATAMGLATVGATAIDVAKAAASGPRGAAAFIRDRAEQTHHILEQHVQNNPTAFNIGAATVVATAVDVAQMATLGPGGAADFFDQKAAESKKIIGQHVQNNPASIAAATAIGTAIDLGRGEVDILRLGKGFEKGGTWGYAEDGLRLIGFATHVASVGYVKSLGTQAIRLSRANIARFVTDVAPEAGICHSISTAQALRQTGHRLFATVDTIAEALETRVTNLEGHAPYSFHEWNSVYSKLGLEVRQLRATTEADIVKAVKSSPNGVVQFIMNWDRRAHTIYAYRDPLSNQIRYIDRSSRALGRVAQKSLKELDRLYKGIKSGFVQDAIFIKEAKMVSDPVRQTVTVAIPMRTAVLTRKDIADQALHFYQRSGKALPISVSAPLWKK
jgi:hypothetical protein